MPGVVPRNIAFLKRCGRRFAVWIKTARMPGACWKVADGVLSNSLAIMRTMKEKAIDAANDTNTDSDRAIIQKDIDQQIDQLNDNSLVTFNPEVP